MNILLVIDHFGAGGAQRQIVELACGLKRRGHSVEMFAYSPRRDFFRPLLDTQQIVVHEYLKGSRFSFGVVRRLAALIAAQNIDVVVSYLSSPNIYAELAQLLGARAKLIVSERTSHYDDSSRVSAHLRRVMHLLADHVVANSHAQCEWLKRKFWLKRRVSCIYNGVDAGGFLAGRAIPESGDQLRLVAMGRVGPEKNAINLVRGLALFHREFGFVPEISWVGEREGGRSGQLYCERLDELLEQSPEVKKRWRWLGAETNVPGLLREHHALIHPSLYEGLPNAVCEALAAGMPVLVSNVCDHPRLVADGERGFLFDPVQPRSIAAAIKSLVDLSAEDWCKFSHNARRYAEENLDVEKMITNYEALFTRLLPQRTDMSGASREDCP
jgi:glycosyltransferase involved in cell wall biosynthesis